LTQPVLLAAAKFIAHLVNQQVAHEIIALELLTLLLEKPSEDSVEVRALAFHRGCSSYAVFRSADTMTSSLAKYAFKGLILIPTFP
jgi:hypothetical protein